MGTIVDTSKIQGSLLPYTRLTLIHRPIKTQILAQKIETVLPIDNAVHNDVWQPM